MSVRILIGGGIGLAAGAALGWFGKCRSGVCPIIGNPYGGAIVGAILGVAVAMMTGTRGTSAQGMTSEAFQQRVLKSARPVLVDFYADWCGPCRVLSPTLEALAKDYQGRADLVKVNVDDSKALAGQYRVEAIPTVVLFVGGRETRRWVGVEEAAEYRTALDAALGPAIILPGTRPADSKEPPMTQPAVVTMKGKPLTLSGRPVQVGQEAPDFLAVDNDLKAVRLSDFRGKTVVLASVPSLDTAVCSLQTRTFNEKAGRLGGDVVVLTISMDLPFAQKRWCGAENIQHVRTLSDHREASFGLAYGVLIGDLRLLARAVFVVDASGTVRYKEIVPEITREPDYDKALAVVGDLTGGRQ